MLLQSLSLQSQSWQVIAKDFITGLPMTHGCLLGNNGCHRLFVKVCAFHFAVRRFHNNQSSGGIHQASS